MHETDMQPSMTFDICSEEKVMKANPKLGAYFDGEVDAAQKAAWFATATAW